jgi:hypothetical protein
MVNLRLIAACCFMFTATFNLSHAEVYKWKDSEGKFRYSDVPPRSDTSYEVLNKKKSVREVSVTQSENKQAKPIVGGNVASKEANDLAVKAQDKQKESAEKLKAETARLAEENAAINAENCQAAQSNLATYKNGGRIKRVNEKGEAIFLTDADIASSVKSAQKEVEKYCKS